MAAVNDEGLVIPAAYLEWYDWFVFDPSFLLSIWFEEYVAEFLGDADDWRLVPGCLHSWFHEQRTHFSFPEPCKPDTDAPAGNLVIFESL